MTKNNLNTYISLHAHSDYSNLKFPDAINTVESLIDSAYQLGLSGVALTDHDTVSGYIRAEHHMAKRKRENPDDERWQNFKLILGNEIYLCKNGLTKENYDKEQDRYYHFILLAKDKIGNDQIRKLSSKAWTRSYMYFHRRIPTYWSDLEEVIQADQGHVIGTSACLGGQIPFLITRRAEYEVGSEEYNSYTEALYRIFDKLVSIFGKEDFYVELQPGLTPEQKLVNIELLKFSAELGIKPIVSTDAHYGNKEERGVHRAYLNSKKGDREVDAFYEAAYLMDTEEIRERMDYLDSEVLDTLFQNTLDIGVKCEEYSLLKDLRIPYLPQDRFEQELQVPLIGAEKFPHFMKYYNSNEAADKQLAVRVWNFLQTDKSVGSKFDTKMATVERELGIIWESSEKMKVRWSKYFLQMADYMEIIWTDGDSITAPSRGSGGASYLMYILGIIQIDPTEETAPLMFERFINPDRASVLDVDTDVESSKRRKVIAAMQNVYGEDHVVRVATFKTEKTKSTIINSARGLGIDADTASYIAGLVGQERGIQYDLKTMYYGDEERGVTPHPTFVKEMNKRPKLWAMCQRIEGLINGIGVHAGGIIIDDKPIYNSASVIKTTKGEIVTAFDLHDCEAASLIKIDLLATKGLSKIRTTLDLLADHGYIEREETLKETYEKVIGVYNLDRKSKEMWEMIHRHEVASLFQMEQQSGIQGIYLTRPTTLEDLAALNSIIRLMASEPGAELPLEKYARYRKDPKAWDNEMDIYGLSEEEKALMHQMFDYSSGVAAQQEDLYQVILEPKIAGFSFGEADVLRKIVAKFFGHLVK